MPRKLTTLNRDDVIQRYRAGASVVKVAEQLGISTSPVRRILREAGIVIEQRPPGNKIARLDVEELARAYRRGDSLYELTIRYGVSRTALERRLKEAGVELRDQSAANRLRMEQLAPHERAALTVAAYNAWRGQQHRKDSMRAIADQTRAERRALRPPK